ncbi:MAG: hypothetical protein IAG13_38085, partial [Deltaproteobacteria bacterium]|nr:hypothetical protein [Nannocystaceae bacterium]
EPEPEVLGECFAALLELVGAPAVVDVARYLRHADAATAEAAALALGGSRLPGAFTTLREADESLIGGDGRRIRLLAIALVREPEAWAYLLGLVEHGATPAAEDAIRAIATFRHDDELMARVSETVARRGDTDIQRTLEELLADDT